MKEEEIKKMVENGEFVSVKDKKEIQKYVNLAKKFNKKNKTITIRINEDDLYKLKLKALSNGIAYQNIIQSLIHKYVNEEIKVEL